MNLFDLFPDPAHVDVQCASCHATIQINLLMPVAEELTVCPLCGGRADLEMTPEEVRQASIVAHRASQNYLN